MKINKIKKRIICFALSCLMLTSIFPLGRNTAVFTSLSAYGTNMVCIEVPSPDGSMEMFQFPMPADQAASEDSTLVSPPPAGFNPLTDVVTLIDNGKSDEDSIVITILGDGFSASEQDKFITEATSLANGFINYDTYSYFKNLFKVYAIKVKSDVSGIPTNQTTSYGNYFQTAFNYGGIDRLLYFVNGGSGFSRAKELLDTYTPEWDLPMMLANSEKYGGAGGTIPIASICSDRIPMMAHELAHTLGLADEYWQAGYETEGPNKTKNKDNPIWKVLIGVNGTGTYQYGTSGTAASWYRPAPSNTCAMEVLSKPFCSVCSAYLTGELASFANINAREDFFGKSTIASSDISSSQTRILPYAYYGCEQLTTVTIPSSIKSIERYAFVRCTKLTSITNNASVPQKIDNTTFFDVTRSNVTLTIPTGTKAAYEAAGWTGFKIVESVSSSHTTTETPNITLQPSDKTANVGDSVTLSVTADVSIGTLSYQWYQNTTKSNNGGTVINGATSASYNPPTTTEGTKYYYCEVTNTDNTATQTKTASVNSQTVSVVLSVSSSHTTAETPNITLQPSDKTANVGDSVTLSVTADVSIGTLSYQWSEYTTKWTEISGATSASYNPPTTTEGTKYYYCEVTNTDNTATQTKTASVNSQTVSVVLSVSSSLKLGDNNADDKVNLIDVVYLKRYQVGWFTEEEFEKYAEKEGYEVYGNRKNGDINGDGIVSLNDILALKRYTLGWWTYEEFIELYG